MNAITEVQDPLLFTDNAANKVKQLIEEEGNADVVKLIKEAQTGPAFRQVAKKYELLPLNPLHP